MTEHKTAKQLAIEKGLFRVRRPRDPSTRTDHWQEFAYLLVLDFESTCWEDRQISQEVIEFPVILCSTSVAKNAGRESDDIEVEILEQFHSYVVPIENPTLSNFCVALTGISQLKVDAEGTLLRICLERFRKWIKMIRNKYNLYFEGENTNDKNQKAAFMTWTSWDLSCLLPNECKRKNLRMPKEMKSWIDLKILFKEFYGSRPTGLKDAMSELSLNFDGREHSGIDDAINTAKLAIKFIRDGHILHLTRNDDEEESPVYRASSLVKTKDAFLKESLVAASTSYIPPQSPVSEPVSSNSSLKTKPLTDVKNTLGSKKDAGTIQLATAPFCNCGQRSKLCKVNKAGPNQ